MTNKLYIALFFIFLTGMEMSYAQFIDLELDIEPELQAETELSLNFGDLFSNTGLNEIQFGDSNMGVFSITALENNELLVSLVMPDSLTHSNPAIRDYIPLDLYVRYGFERNNYQNTEILGSTLSSLVVEENTEVGPWTRLYLFVYGSIEVGNVSQGTYSGEILLTIEYL